MWSVKKIWFQLHWFIGITAGTVLMVIGVSGAVLAFREEILGLVNPGTATVTAPAGAIKLAPVELAAAMQKQGETRRVERLAVYAEPGRSAMATFAPPPGERRGERRFVNPYTGELLAKQEGAEFFAWTERLHRFLLLSRDTGKPITGSLSLALIFLSISGIYLRWPAKPLSLRAWFTFNTSRKGRPFLWGLHSVAGTWVLVVYLMLTLTGIYWAFDVVRSTVDQWAGLPPRTAAAAPQQPKKEEPPAEPLALADIAPAWAGFSQLAPGWQFAQLNLPQRASQPVQISWYDASAPHERARNQLRIKADGTVQRDERYDELAPSRRFVLAIYPLHMGTYFGVTGQLIVMIASLMMPVFGITGWMLYLDRRRKKRAAAREQSELLAGAAPGKDGSERIAVIHASQSGHAQQLAVRTVAHLRAAGASPELLPVAQIDLQQLASYSSVLWIVSTFGEGEPPDNARRFAQRIQRAEKGGQQGLLTHQRFGMLALGDRQYAQFCGFGLKLAQQLEQLGAEPLFAPITMNGEDRDTWNAWSEQIAGQWGGAPQDAADAEPTDFPIDAAFEPWTLTERIHCNPGSLGNPLYVVDLTPPEGTHAQWRAGALVEVQPQHAAEVVNTWLQTHGLDGDARVQWSHRDLSLREAAAGSELPAQVDASDVHAIARQLKPLTPRSYSVASLPEDGRVQLLVRQIVWEGGLGLASGWLTVHAPLGTSVLLKLVENTGFAPSEPPGVPAIFIGNGSGYAGLRAHMRDRIQRGEHDNWFIFGERQQSVDGYAAFETGEWLAQGHITRTDFAWSRDGTAPRYAQEALRTAGDVLRDWVQRGAILYVCGSYQGMGTDVDRALHELLGEEVMETLMGEGRYRRDVY